MSNPNATIKQGDLESLLDMIKTSIIDEVESRMANATALIVKLREEVAELKRERVTVEDVTKKLTDALCNLAGRPDTGPR